MACSRRHGCKAAGFSLVMHSYSAPLRHKGANARCWIATRACIACSARLVPVRTQCGPVRSNHKLPHLQNSAKLPAATGMCDVASRSGPGAGAEQHKRAKLIKKGSLPKVAQRSTRSNELLPSAPTARLLNMRDSSERTPAGRGGRETRRWLALRSSTSHHADACTMPTCQTGHRHRTRPQPCAGQKASATQSTNCQRLCSRMSHRRAPALAPRLGLVQRVQPGAACLAYSAVVGKLPRPVAWTID